MNKNKDIILWAILAAVTTALVITVVMFWGTIKSSFGGSSVPANVRSEDMTSLLQQQEIDEDKLASYSVSWEATLHSTVEEAKKQNTDLAAADLKSEVEKATDVVEKLNALSDLVKGDNHTIINTATMKAQSDIESAQRFIDAHSSNEVAKSAAPTTSSASVPSTGQYVTITGNAVRLRVGPGFGYGVYTHVNKGKTIPYVSTSGDWYCVNYGGRTLYVSNQFAYVSGSSSSSASSSSSSGTYVVINGNGVRLRTGPGEGYGIYTQLNRGARIPYVSTSGDWYCVNYNGRTLYVSAIYSYLN